MNDIDLRIMRRLFDHCRTSYRSLAADLDLSVNALHRRVQQMTAAGIISAFIAGLRFDVLQTHVVHIRGTCSETVTDELCQHLGSNEFVSGIFVGGGNLIRSTCFLRDLSDLDGLVNFFETEAGMTTPEVRHVGPLFAPSTLTLADLSDLDFRIVAALLDDARIALNDLAEQVGATPKTTRAHLNRMIEGKAINLTTGLFGTTYDDHVVTFDIRVHPDHDTPEICSILEKTLEPRLWAFPMIDPPTGILSYAWAQSPADLKRIQDELLAMTEVASAVPYIYYQNHAFSTWRDDFVRDRAQQSTSI